MTILASSIGSILGSAWSIVVAILVLLFMVTIHELGHYIAGKKLGFKINEFAIGFGPAIYKRTMKSGELFSIRCLPLGGYCAFEGEDEESTSSMSFEKQAPWKRIIVLMAGALTNFFVTLLIVVLTFSISGQYMYKVAEVLPTMDGISVSQEHMLQSGDYILEINGKGVYLGTEVSEQLAKVNAENKDSVDVVVLRNGEKVAQTITLRPYEADELQQDGTIQKVNKEGLGILMGSGIVKFNIFDSIGRGTAYCFKMAGQVLSFLGQLLTGQVGVDSMSGPVSTIQVTAQIASNGMRALIEILALIGVNLAVFNLLPVPALDGSKIVFTTIEWIRKKPINRNVENLIHFGGFVFLLGFAILVDLVKYL